MADMMGDVQAGLALVWWKRPIRAVAAALACMAAGTAMAHADILDVTPAALRDALQPPGYTLVLFNSADPKCGFCRGQSETYDAFAREHRGEPRLVRVQWMPWRNFPPAELLPRRVLGVPTWLVFRDAEAVAEHTGRLGAAELRRFVDDAVQGRSPKLAPDVDLPAAATQPPKRPVRPPPPDDPPLTPEERQALATQSRWMLLDEGLRQCAKAQPAQAQHHEAALGSFMAAHQAELELGAELLLKKRGRNTARETDAIQAAETARLEAEIPRGATLAEGCQRMNDIARR